MRPAYSARVSLGLRAWGLGLRTFGGTPNRDSCSLCGSIWGLPNDIGVYLMTIRRLYIYICMVMGFWVPIRDPP